MYKYQMKVSNGGEILIPTSFSETLRSWWLDIILPALFEQSFLSAYNVPSYSRINQFWLYHSPL